MKYVQVSWHLWSYSVMPTVKIGALFCPKYIKTSIIFSGNAQSFRGLRPLDPHQGLAPGPHRGPKAGPWTPPVMGFAPRRSPCTLCVHQIFSQFLYNFGRATFKSWLTPWWHESENINKRSLNPKFRLISILHFQVMHDYVWFIAPIDYCVR